MIRKIQKSGLAKCKIGGFGFFERKFTGKSKPAEIYKIMAKFQVGRDMQGNRKSQDNRKTQDNRKLQLNWQQESTIRFNSGKIRRSYDLYRWFRI